MRYIKYILVSFLIMVAFLATGERFVFHLISFEESFWRITFEYGLYGQEGSETLVKEKIATALEENDLDVFFVDTKFVSDIKEVKTIYGTQGALSDLRRRGISPKTYETLFIGEVEIVFKDFLELEDIYESDQFHIVGTLEQVAKFKNATVKDLEYYEVKDLKEESGSERSVYTTLAFVWGMAFVLVILLTLYNVIISKKEMMIKVTLGENPYRVFAKNVIQDTVIFSLSFFGLSLVLEQFSHVRYKFGFVCLLFLAMLVINALINLLITRIDLKKDFSNDISSKGTLAATYVVKFVSVLLASIILSANFIIIEQCLDYYKQEDFFEGKQDYNYYSISYTLETMEKLNIDRKANEDLWYRFNALFGDSSIRSVDFTTPEYGNAVFMNKNAAEQMMPYVSKDLASKLQSATEEKLYIFFPENCSSDSINNAKALFTTTCLHFEDEDIDKEELIVTETYSGSSKILGINSNLTLYKSRFLKNPIIALDNTKRSMTNRYLNELGFARETLYSVPQSDFDRYIADNNMQNEFVRVTNAKDLYYYNRSTIERNFKLTTALSLLILLLEIAMIVFAVRLEYTVNGVEMSVKKTLGYGVLARGKRLILLPAILIPICTAAAVTIVHMFNLGNPFYVFICGVVLLLGEIIFVISQCIRMDRIKTSLILKGAKL